MNFASSGNNKTISLQGLLMSFNDDLLQPMGKQKQLLNIIKERETQYFGHVLRGERYYLLQLTIEGNVQGKRSLGTHQKSWLKDLRRRFDCLSKEIFRI